MVATAARMQECGYSVAISSTTAAYGCPGANVIPEKLLDMTSSLMTALKQNSFLAPGHGDFFGASVAT